MFKKKTKYSVKNNWLHFAGQPVPGVEEPTRQKYSRGSNICDYILMHYTGGPSVRSAHNTYQLRKTNVSWHITIARDGTIYQLHDFRKRCWHAGISNWRKPNGRDTGGLNKWAIGIELIAGGPLKKINGKWYAWWQEKTLRHHIPDDEVYIDDRGRGWHNITDAQIKACHNIIPVIKKQYKCVDILGHEEVSPRRKVDPGPQGMNLIVKSIRKKFFK